MITKNFSDYSKYYDLLYRDKNYEDEANYIKSLLVRSGLTTGDILEFGCGTGKHARLLSENGYIVHGIELSDGMLSRARELQTEYFTCYQGDIRSIKMHRKYDAVLSLFHVMSYQITNSSVQAVFDRASEHLENKGVFIFDFWYTPAVLSLKPVVRVKRINDDQTSVTRIAEPSIYPNENRVDVKYTIYVEDAGGENIRVLTENHPMRHFSIPELNLFAQNSGFELLNAEEFFTGNEPGDSSWGVCLVYGLDSLEND
jgi:SAM-dependent methyltransferase